MASFTNRRGEQVEVSDEFIERAIEIKIELQKQSASGKCSYARLKKMMHSEGFAEADSNESMRQMIKREQEKRGLLPSVTKYSDMVSDKKLDSIEQAVGELQISKRDAQNAHRELNKMKREWSDRLILIREISEQLKDVKFNKRNKKLEPLDKTDNSIIVPMSDWHIGLRTEEFNLEVANDRVEQYANKVVHYANLFDVNTVNVIGIGDLMNGSYMRANQLAENELSFSEQIVAASDMVFEFLELLSQELNVVYMGSIIGNHSRMSSGAPSNAQEGDSGENILDAVVEKYIKLSKNKRLSVDNKKTSNRDISCSINGVEIKAVHGDLISKKSKEKLQQFISMDEKFYDILLYGHFHHSSYVEENHGRMAIGTGSLQGVTEFSKGLGFETRPSQTLVVLEGDNPIPIRIGLE